MQNSVSASVPLAQPTPRRAIWGLFDRRERWSLSWRGRLIVISALLLVSVLVLKGVYPFLAITDRVDANILVVEGWINEYAIRAAVKEFQSKHYQRVFTTGGPVEGTGGYSNDFMTSASVGRGPFEKGGRAGAIVADGAIPCNGPRQNLRVGCCTADLVSRP